MPNPQNAERHGGVREYADQPGRMAALVVFLELLTEDYDDAQVAPPPMP